MKALLVFLIIAVSFILSPENVLSQTKYKHPSLDFQFTASENWKKINHPEDEMILEMVDPNDAIHVILWVTETESDPKPYLEKMVDMKGLQITGDPIAVIAAGQDAWIIKAEGKINGVESTSIIASIPMTGEKDVHHKDHVAQYIIQIWCPTDLFPQKVKEIEKIQASIEIL